MADSNTAAPAIQPTEQPPTFVSKVIAHLWEFYDFVLTAMMATIFVLIQPYVFCYNLAKSIYDTFAELITIGAMSIRAAHLYLQVWIRFLNGMNKDDKPAETVITAVKNIGKAVNNINKRLQDEPRSSSKQYSEQSQPRGSTAFQPIRQVDECTPYRDCCDVSECGSNGYGQGFEGTCSPPGDADQRRPPTRNGSGNGGGDSNGSSNGGGGGGTGSNGSPSVNGYNRPLAKTQAVSFDASVKSATASSSSTTESSSTVYTVKPLSAVTYASHQHGVDEVDKSGRAKVSPKQTPVSSPAAAYLTKD